MKTLIPFANTPKSDLFQVEAEIYVDGPDSALLEYKITGPLDELLFPEVVLTESRRDELWKATCLEAFFAPDTQPEDSYLELNCAPNGDWNAYEFDSYRQGMQTSVLTSLRLIHRESTPQEALFRLRLQCPGILQMKWASLTVILQLKDGSYTYWALKHPRPQPDFHDKDAFIAPL